MSYASGENQILTLLRAITPATWDADNSVSLANDASNKAMVAFNSGKDYHYLFLEPAPFGAVYQNINFSQALITWQTRIKICVLKTTNRGPMKVLAADREAAILQLLKYERLSNQTGVMHAGPIGSQTGGPILIERVRTKAKTIVYFKQEVIWQWDELVSISQQD